MQGRILNYSVGSPLHHHLAAKLFASQLVDETFLQNDKSPLQNQEQYFCSLTQLIEHDIRVIAPTIDSAKFYNFLQICAQYINKKPNYSVFAKLGNISIPTIQRWFLLARDLQIITFDNRKILYFLDPGLACTLLGIRTAYQFHYHYLRAEIIQSYITTKATHDF